MKALPEAFVTRMKGLLGEGYEAYEASFQAPAVRSFRVNTNKISLEEFEKLDSFSSGKIPYVETGYYLDYDKIGNHPIHHAGMIYVQDPGAMAPAECLDIQPDWRVLDLCAAPGGKSSQLRNKLGEEGILVSNEIIASRCRILTGNMERLGFRNTVTTCMAPAKLAKLFPKTFDLVMVDAPCSGEGMLRKDENAIDEWSLENVLHCAARQKDILESAAAAVKDGGHIIYATCTFSLEENEMVLDHFLTAHPDFELLPVREAVRSHTAEGISFAGCRCENLHDARRFYPHKSRGEGQFMAVLHSKNEASGCHTTPSRKMEKLDKVITDFLDDVLTDYDKTHVTVYNGNPVYFTPDMEIPKGAAFSCGVTIGEVRKNYIQPHHQFFMAMGPKFRRKVELTGADLERYLHGEEIGVDCPNGWAVVTTHGCSLGGVKVVNGRAKNHYPKGLRKLS
ncbi:MAG: RNA methyltransferase, partial [Oscillibacter sp.]|nr:RNA methyltransferase [Oscillibacter sp.]